MFIYAAELEAGREYRRDEATAFIRETLAGYLD
jgi:hypothetical protein